MDRRQKKTRKAIFSAFRSLLEKKRYERITVQDIIDEADIGRSTFYAHFETKDLLLDAMCGEIFHHIFKYDPCPWNGSDEEIEGKLSHTLWHIRESRNDISGLLLSDSSGLFMRYFKEHLRTLFEMYVGENTENIPRDFLIDHLVGSFAEAVLWWFKEKMQTSPEDLARYFVSVTSIKKYANSNR